MTGHTPAATVDAIRAGRLVAGSRPCSRPKTRICRRRTVARALRPPVLADRDDGHRCEPVRAAARPGSPRPGRDTVLVFNWCYHGTVDETLGILGITVASIRGPGNIGPPVDPAVTTKIVELDGIDTLEAALAPVMSLCVLAEPALTNIGIVTPPTGLPPDRAPRDHAPHRHPPRDRRDYTICVGPGGGRDSHVGSRTRLLRLSASRSRVECPRRRSGCPQRSRPGSPTRVGRRRDRRQRNRRHPHGRMRSPWRPSVRRSKRRSSPTRRPRMIPLARAMDGRSTRRVHRGRALPWSVNQLERHTGSIGSRNRPRNGAEAAAAVDERQLDSFMHLWALNRGILLTPFHNMALMSPSTTAADVDRTPRSSVNRLSSLRGRGARARCAARRRPSTRCPGRSRGRSHHGAQLAPGGRVDELQRVAPRSAPRTSHSRCKAPRRSARRRCRRSRVWSRRGGLSCRGPCRRAGCPRQAATARGRR